MWARTKINLKASALLASGAKGKTHPLYIPRLMDGNKELIQDLFTALRTAPGLQCLELFIRLQKKGGDSFNVTNHHILISSLPVHFLKY
jgi:hypothetical protein